ncbi:MAG TPA: metalloregulator ArsR/SmtB family transcription factor [Candidatus Xenobia bacterium]
MPSSASNDTGQALRIFKAEIFKALAHPTRIGILELLRDRELCVTDLCSLLGLDPPNVSQHLTVLRNKNILTSRRDGLIIYYRVKNPVLYQVLDLFRQWFYQHLSGNQEMLDQLKLSERPGPSPV